MSSERIGIAIVWIVAVVGAVVSLAALPAELRDEGIGLTMAACVLGTFGIQLAAGKPAGYLGRAVASIVGALVILSVAGLIRLVLPS